MQLGAMLRSQRGWLAGSAFACYLLALILITAGLVRGGSNVMARGGIEVVDGLLCLLVVVSFSLGMGPTNRRYFQLVQVAMALFAATFISGGMFDLGTGRAANLVAGVALLGAALALMAAVVEYVASHHTQKRGLAALLDLGILIVSMLALAVPLVLIPLWSHGGIHLFATGVAWMVELALFVGTLWIAVGWLRRSEQMDFLMLVAALGWAFVIATIHVGLALAGQPSIPWWLQALYGPGLIVIALAPDFGVTPAGALARGGERWSRVQVYLPYLPAVVLEMAALWVTITGRLSGGLGRGLVAGAVAVSALLVVRQAVLLRAHRSLLDERSLQALRDPLTGLLNRRAFQEDLEQLVYHGSRDHSTFSLLLVDLDELKKINDGKGGHSAGDSALQELGRALAKSGRREDRAYRIGGDEFAVLYPGADRQTAQRSMTRARHELKQMAPEAAFSYGISEFPGDGLRADVLFSAADRELYSRKAGARPIAEVPIPSLNPRRPGRAQSLT